ncbi:hypothetical protein [Azospirillum sp.]|uniref:hypothetical protein n=1 Tax=Azospirillum sp. TaxID=34012 RepID=UPI002D36DDA7|nr:hypothetical protein [Azospirillum sp.]HYD64282.1 hypothetical protein [Azospirillum sp.]
MRERAKECLSRAHALLSAGDEASIRYACLEICLALELLCYEKLEAFIVDLPIEKASSWRPKDVMAAILELDPDAEQDMKVTFWKDDEGGLPGPEITLGEYKTFGGKWANKAHNTLSSFLHAPTLDDNRNGRAPNPIAKKRSIEDIYEKLLCIASSNITSVRYSPSIVNFECSECHAKIKRKDAGLIHHKSVECFKCKALYLVERTGDGVYFTLKEAGFRCVSCGGLNVVGQHMLKHGKEISCNKCSFKNTIVRSWAVLAKR